MTRQSTIFGGGGGANNSFPSVSYADAFARMNNPDQSVYKLWANVPGFVGDGDYIKIPVNADANPLEYYDAAGSLQWSNIPSAFGTITATRWIGFELRGSLLWFATANQNNEDMEFFTIDQAGTITPLGPKVNYTKVNAIDPNWVKAPSSAGASNLVFDIPNELVYVIYQVTSTAPVMGIWNYVTGALVQDFAYFEGGGGGINILAQNGMTFAATTNSISLMNYLDNVYGQSVNIINSWSGEYTNMGKGLSKLSSYKAMFIEDGYWMVNTNQDNIKGQVRYWLKDDMEATLVSIYNEVYGAELDL